MKNTNAYCSPWILANSKNSRDFYSQWAGSKPCQKAEEKKRSQQPLRATPEKDQTKLKKRDVKFNERNNVICIGLGKKIASASGARMV